MEKTWPLISDPEKFKLFKQREIKGVEQITKSAFNPDEFQSMFGAYLGMPVQEGPAQRPPESGGGKRKRRNSQKKKKNKSNRKKQRKSKASRKKRRN